MKQFKTLSLLLVLALLISACSKDQKVIKQLEGTWKITAMTVDGTAVDAEFFSGTSTTFPKCKQKKETCVGTQTATFEFFGTTFTTTTEFNYEVKDKGETFVMTVVKSTTDGVSTECTDDCTNTSTITEHSKEKFVTEFTDDDGVKTVTTMEKQ